MDHDAAFANAPFIPDGEAYPARWAARAAAFRAGLGARFCPGLPVPGGAAAGLDLFLPEGEPAGLCVFFHGGYWKAFGPRDFSHLAAGALARGWAVALPAYTLAPAARIARITAEATAALVEAARLVPGPVAVTGHSAGGHLAARMVAAGLDLPAGVRARLVRVVPVSPLSDLRPLLRTSMNAVLGIDAAEARAESPVLLPLRPGPGLHVWVGGAERPAFLDQARRLGNAWACPVTVEPGRHHFDVIEGLEAEGPLLAALLG